MIWPYGAPYVCTPCFQNQGFSQDILVFLVFSDHSRPITIIDTEKWSNCPIIRNGQIVLPLSLIFLMLLCCTPLHTALFVVRMTESLKSYIFRLVSLIGRQCQHDRKLNQKVANLTVHRRQVRTPTYRFKFNWEREHDKMQVVLITSKTVERLNDRQQTSFFLAQHAWSTQPLFPRPTYSKEWRPWSGPDLD